MKVGRPTDLDDIKAKRVVDAIGQGNSRRAAAALVGANPATFYRWMQSDEKFRERVRQADAKAETYVVGRLFELLEGERPSFEAIRFWLKTRRPHSWREMAPAASAEPSNDLSGKSEEELVAAVEKWMSERKAKVG